MMAANNTPTKSEFAKKTISGLGTWLTRLIILIVDVGLGYLAFKC